MLEEKTTEEVKGVEFAVEQELQLQLRFAVHSNSLWASRVIGVNQWAIIYILQRDGDNVFLS